MMPRNGAGAPQNGIGTLQETSLHADLKRWYTQPGDQVEVRVDGYVVDIVRGELLIEIQTRNFSALKRKLNRLIENHPVRLVYPIPIEKWIVRLAGPENDQESRRRSPKRGQLMHVFEELVRIPGLIASPNFSLEVLFIREEELRQKDGRGSWRRKGWSIFDRRLVEVVDRAVFQTPADFQDLLPPGLPAPFTTRDLARAAGLPLYLARKMAYCLREMDMIHISGKRGHSLLYMR